MQSQISYHDDKHLMTQFETLVKNCQPYLYAVFEPYTLYNSSEGKVYALIHADYKENDGIVDDEVDIIAKNDSIFIHNALKESGLKIDYIFVMPYYDYTDTLKSSFLSDPIITKDM